MNLLDNFQRYIRRNELAAPEDFILLTVSGGVDSMVMLSLFVRSGYRVGVATRNDGYELRRAAVRHGITYATTLAAAQALIAGMQAARAGELDVAPLQEL